MRTDVKVGVALSAVLVTAVGGYYLFRDSGGEAVAVTAQTEPSAQVPNSVAKAPSKAPTVNDARATKGKQEPRNTGQVATKKPTTTDGAESAAASASKGPPRTGDSSSDPRQANAGAGVRPNSPTPSSSGAAPATGVANRGNIPIADSRTAAAQGDNTGVPRGSESPTGGANPAAPTGVSAAAARREELGPQPASPPTGNTVAHQGAASGGTGGRVADPSSATPDNRNSSPPGAGSTPLTAGADSTNLKSESAATRMASRAGIPGENANPSPMNHRGSETVASPNAGGASAPSGAANPSRANPPNMTSSGDVPPSGRMAALPTSANSAMSGGKTVEGLAKPSASNAKGSTETHRVQPGDTLASLAQNYYGSERFIRHLLASNPQLRDPNRLAVGTVLKIPPVPDSDSESSSGNSAAPGTLDRIGPGRTYRVQAGDSFYSIAKSILGDSARWKELLALNRESVHGDATQLQIGQVLKLPER